jgi:hypothetical protein
MKLISLLIVLLLIGFLVKKQLDSGSSSTEYDEIIESKNLSTPKVPSSPKGVKKFDVEINDFMKESAEEKERKLEEVLNK